MTVQMVLGLGAFVSFFVLWVVLPTFIKRRVERKYDLG